MAESKQAKEEELLAKLNKWWSLADSYQTEWQNQAQRDLDFYLGKQWDSKDIDKLNREGRPALTFNHIRAPINLVSGYERQNKHDIKVVNKKGGSRVLAEVLTKLIKDIMDTQNGSYEKSLAFWKGIITARGWLALNMDYEEDPINGNIVIEEVSPFKVFPDPFFEKYDLRDAMFMFKIAWLPKDKIEQTWPDKKKDLESLHAIEKDKQSIDYGDDYRDSRRASGTGEEKEYKYRTKECTWIDYKKVKYLVNSRTGEIRNAEDWTTLKLKAMTAIFPDWKVVERSKKTLHLTQYVGNVILQDLEDPFNGVTRHLLIPFFAYWIEGKWRSLITDLQDPQQEINKRRSQLLHHLNQSAHSGWIADEDAVADWKDVEDFGSKPGVIIKVRKNKRLDRIDPAPLSEGHLILAKEAEMAIKIVSGVNADLLGLTPERQESGVAMQLRQRQGNITIESLFDNLRLTEKILGQTLIEMIQRSGVYSKEEMVKVVIDGQEQEVQVNQKTQGMLGAIEKIQNDLSIGRYAVTVTSSPITPTARLANFYALTEMAKQGLPVPPDMIIEQSDMPNKEEMIRRLKEAKKGPSKEEIDAQAQAGEQKFKAQELALKMELEVKKLEQEALLKREEFDLKRELKVMDVRKAKTSK